MPHEKWFEDLIDNAQKKIRILMFTFTDDVIVQKVIDAHKRGVDVRVIVDPNVHAFGLRMMGCARTSLPYEPSKKLEFL